MNPTRPTCTDKTGRPRTAALIAGCLTWAVGAGCAGTAGELAFEPSTGYPPPFTQEFRQAYAVERQNQSGTSLKAFSNHDVVLFEETPGADGELSQYVRIRTLWPYIKGLSHTNPSQINCTVDYVRADRRGSVFYQGAGMVHVVSAGGKYKCRIKSALLAFRGATGEATDDVGNFDLTGEFVAGDDPLEHAYYVRRFSRVVELLRATAEPLDPGVIPGGPGPGRAAPRPRDGPAFVPPFPGFGGN